MIICAAPQQVTKIAARLHYLPSIDYTPRSKQLFFQRCRWLGTATPSRCSVVFWILHGWCCSQVAESWSRNFVSIVRWSNLRTHEDLMSTGAPVVGTPILGTHYIVSCDADVCGADRESNRTIQGRMHWAVYFALQCFTSGATLG